MVGEFGYEGDVSRSRSEGLTQSSPGANPPGTAPVPPPRRSLTLVESRGSHTRRGSGEWNHDG